MNSSGFCRLGVWALAAATLACRAKDQAAPKEQAAHRRAPLAMLRPTALAPRDTTSYARLARQPEDPVSLVFVGTYDPPSLRAVSGEVLLGFFRSQGGWTVTPTIIKVDADTQPCGPGFFSGRPVSYPRVTIETRDTLLFLLRGVRIQRPGPVHTFLADRTRVYPGQVLGGLELRPDRWELLGYGNAPFASPLSRGDVRVHDYRLVLWSREVTQTLYAGNVYYLPEVLWVGDLDGDGKIDVVLLPHEGELGPQMPELWLSSLAATGELVHRVIGNSTVYCD